MPHLTSLATLVAVLFYAMLGVRVSRARVKARVPAPAMVGDPEFERAVRIQANTLEWMPVFLPSLWLAAIYVSDPAAAALARRLDRRPRAVREGLCGGGQQARTRVHDPASGDFGALARRGVRRGQSAAPFRVSLGAPRGRLLFQCDCE